MRLEHLYALRLSYRELWTIGSERFGVMEGRCQGALAGSFVGANRARIREDGVYLPHVQGVISTEDGAAVLFDLNGRGGIGEDGAFHAVGSVTHVAEDERYTRLNDVVCALEASSGPDDEEIALEIYEIVGGAAPS